MADDFGSMIEKAMADPRFGEIFGMLKEKADKGEIDVSKIGEALGGAGGDKHVGAEKPSEKAQGASSDVLSKIPDISALLGGKGGKHDFAKHERLLSALRPYLSDGKKNAVDTVLGAAKLGDIIEALGGVGGRGDPSPTNIG